MDINFDYKEVIGFGLAVPFFTSIVVLLAFRVARGVQSLPYVSALALVAGFVAPCVLFSWAPIHPSLYWHWLPYLAVMAMVTGSVGWVTPYQPFSRWFLHLLLATAVALLLVPSWQDLQPMRMGYVAALAGSVLLLCVLVEPLAKLLPGEVIPASFFGVAAAGAVVLVLGANIMFAQLAGAAGAAMLGCAIVSRYHRSEAVIQSATAAFVVISVGLMFVGYLDSSSNVPLLSYVLVSAAPIMLWLCAVGPLSRIGATLKLLVQLALIMAPLAAALYLALMAEKPWNWI